MQCKQCSTGFQITDVDREFYKRVSPVIGGKPYAVPEPTLCPACRQQRRYAIRNERNLYRRPCGLCKKDIIAMYSPDKPFPVYCFDCWWGDGWDATDFGRDFDFSRPFFPQFRALQEAVPRVGLYQINCENSDYCNFAGDCKNCYLTFGTVYSEDCLYGSAYYSKNCVDNLVTRECERCYECIDSRKLFNCFYAQDCYQSDHLLFCYDLQGCSECIACAGLRNKKYHIENKPYSKDDYEKIKAQIDFCKPGQMEALKKRLEEVKLKTPHHYMPSNNVQNVSGSHIYNSKNVQQSFFADRCEDCAYSMQVVDLKDCQDNNYTEENELCYEYLGMYAAKNSLFSTFFRHSHDALYSEYCISSGYLFGCLAVRNKQHCIFNKPYSKAEWETLVSKLIDHMKSTGEWGQFFPVSLSPFAYNETVAQEYFPLAKEEALSRGYMWKEPDKKDYRPQTIEVPRKIGEVGDAILDEALACKVCGKNYKIIAQELRFYRDMKLPVPSFCPDCRHKNRLAMRNPRALYDRACAKCHATIHTVYAPNRPEKVYCEACYLKEIY